MMPLMLLALPRAGAAVQEARARRRKSARGVRHASANENALSSGARYVCRGAYAMSLQHSERESCARSRSRDARLCLR